MKTRLYEVGLSTEYGGGLLVIEATTKKVASKIAADYCEEHKSAGLRDDTPTPVKTLGKNGVRASFQWVE